MRHTAFALLAVAALALAAGGCHHGIHEDPILRLSATEALTQGKDLMAKKKYAKARRFLSHSFEVEPNSLSGREALLLLADSYYLDGGSANDIQAEAKYRDFLNRFPTSPQAGYAQFQIANSLAERMEKPDRDQSATDKALEAYQELIRLYPTSEYVAEAKTRMIKVRDNLAEHEFVVGHFYLAMRAPASAVTRLQRLVDEYPDYSQLDKALYYLGVAYSRSRRPEDAGKAAEVFARLRKEYPQSPYVAEIPESLPSAPTPNGQPNSPPKDPQPAPKES
jgi:outer membrane protein assembly factor BamD